MTPGNAPRAAPDLQFSCIVADRLRAATGASAAGLAAVLGIALASHPPRGIESIEELALAQSDPHLFPQARERKREKTEEIISLFFSVFVCWVMLRKDACSPARMSTLRSKWQAPHMLPGTRPPSAPRVAGEECGCMSTCTADS